MIVEINLLTKEITSPSDTMSWRRI